MEDAIQIAHPTLLVVPNMDTGGAQTFVYNFAKFNRTKFPIVIFKDPKHPIKEAYKKELCIYSVPSLSLRNSPYFISKILYKIITKLGWFRIFDRWFIRHIVRKHKISRINTHMFEADDYIINHLGFSDLPVVSTLHGCYNLILSNGSTFDKSYFEEFIQKSSNIFKSLKGLIYLTESQVAILLEHNLKLPTVVRKIYNGFNLKAVSLSKSNSIPSSIRMGMVARGEETKGWEIAIKSFIKCRDLFPNIKMELQLIGDSSYLTSLREKYISQREIIFLGQIDAPLDYIKTWDIGLLPSYFKAESLPTSIIEYMFCGVATVASKIGEIQGMLCINSELQCGLVSEVNGNDFVSENSVVENLKRYIANPSLLELHKTNSLIASERFNIVNCINSYQKVMLDI